MENTLHSIIDEASLVDLCPNTKILVNSSCLIKLLAVIALYHARGLLEGHDLHDGHESFDDVAAQVRECAFAESLKVFPMAILPPPPRIHWRKALMATASIMSMARMSHATDSSWVDSSSI